MKPCGHCKISKEFSKFYRNSKNRSGYASWCKDCYKLVFRIHDGKTNGRKLYQRYGIDRDKLSSMHLAQDRKCKICQIHLIPDSKRGSKNYPNIDHDHRTGKVRGILCFRCNSALGLFDEDTSRLETAIRYLENEGDV